LNVPKIAVHLCGEAPLGYAEPNNDQVIEYNEDVLAALDREEDFE